MSDTCILHVEDEENDVLLFKLAMEAAEVTVPVQVVTDGQTAIDYLSGASPFADRAKYPLPCLVLLDLKLPRKSGLEVLGWLRSQPLLRRMVVIVCTSAEHEHDIARAYELGANSYIVKPMDIAERKETARRLKAWWLACNRFPPLPKDQSGSVGP